MTSSSLRLRQTLRTVAALHRSLAACPATSASRFSAQIQHPISSTPTSRSLSSHSPYLIIQSRAFRASSISLLSARSTYNNSDEIGPDTILFEGCDYNHWLFVMDFPKDPKPTPEQMVQTYEETCAKGLNISVEEAKKKMYACSTTTYTGFQAVMTEEESEKFQGLPGVIFVLPDSYIDPVNKEYGGDKYINGVIIPRPPPIQYGRNQGRRNRNFDQPRQGNRMSNPPGNPSYNNQGSMQGDGRNYGPSQNYPPQQNYGPASQNYPPQQNYGPPSQNYPPQQNYGPSSQNYPPQQNYGSVSQNYTPQQTYGSASQQYQPSSPQQSFGPPGQGERHDSVPTPGEAGAYQAQRGNPSPSYQNNINQVGQRNYYPQEQRGSQQGYPNAGQGDWAADYRNYNKSSETGNYGQGVASPGTGGPYGQGGHPGSGQNFSGHVENQGFTHREQRNAQGEQGSYTPFPQTGTDQRRY